MAEQVILLAPVVTVPAFVSESQAYSMFIAPGLASALRVSMQVPALQVFESGVFVEGVFS